MPVKRKAETEFHLQPKCSRVEEVLTRGSNALMQLNEIGIKGLKWNIEQVSNMFPQRFRATCLFTEPFTGIHEVIPSGVLFIAEGISKSVCRHDVADQIMAQLTKKNINVAPPIITDSPLTNEMYCKTINNTNNEAIRVGDALRLLNEKVSGIVYEFKLDDDGYHCSVNFEGKVFQSTASSKKVAKRIVAVEILEKHFKNSFTEDDDISQSTSVDGTTTVDTNKLSFNRRKNFSNQIQAMVKNGFEKLATALDVQNSKRKVLSGIIISRKLEKVFPNYGGSSSQPETRDTLDPLQFYTETGWTLNPDDNGEILKLVTISSGMKCLPNNENNSLGNCLNDCHAEVVAKRALQYFLYKTIGRLNNNAHLHPSEDALKGCDILEIFGPDDLYAYKLKEDVKFHLYVSISPCGDSRIFFPHRTDGEENRENSNGHLHSNKIHRGLLRRKLECSEGTVPTLAKHIEIWDGILEDDRLSTMSCSDKICVWNVLGLQGALLSNVLSEPIYLDSITIGSVFQLDHSEKALFDRAKGVINESDWLSHLPNVSNKTNEADIEQGELKIVTDTGRSFRVNTPYILTVTDQDERFPGKGSSFSGNWILGEDCFELVSTIKGLTVDNTPSRLSKSSLLKSFLSVFKWLPFIFPESGVFFYIDMKKLFNYPVNAIGAVNYRRKKAALLKYFEDQNLGKWIGKPIEQDCFRLKFEMS